VVEINHRYNFAVLGAANEVGTDLFTGYLGEYDQSPRGNFPERSGLRPDGYH
jgi:hypothetical protein